LKGIVKVGAMDLTVKENEEMGRPYDVKGFPTIKFFGANKKNPDTFSGDRTAQGLADYALEKA
jgi:protein disulfide-isomerase A6